MTKMSRRIGRMKPPPEIALPEDRNDRASDERVWFVPKHIDIVSNELRWSRARGPAVRRQGRLWGEFLALTGREVTGAMILAFARRWGVLHLCALHRLPWNHPPLGDQSVVPSATLSRFGVRCEPARRDVDHFVEPLSAWQDWLNRARAVLEIAGRLEQRRQVEKALWRQASDWPGLETIGDRPGSAEGRRSDRQQLALVVNDWLRLGKVRLNVEWREERPTVFLGSGDLFGAIALQIALAVTHQEQGVALCSTWDCGNLFPPGRRPQAGRRRYCPTCRERGIPEKDAAQDFRDRQRRQKHPG
jgi:hypothetical protein